MNKDRYKKKLRVDDIDYEYYCIQSLLEDVLGKDKTVKVPFSAKVVIENILRNLDDNDSQAYEKLKSIVRLSGDRSSNADKQEAFAFYPTRVLFQDFTGVPAIVDFASLRDEVRDAGKNPSLVNPKRPIHLVIDHSVQVDYTGKDALQKNVDVEMIRNKERYQFLKWGQQNLTNFKVVRPGFGICHQVNIEYLAKVVWAEVDTKGKMQVFPDTVIGTDSHTTMVNGMSVLGWGVGGIEAESVLLGQPILMNMPKVIGFKLKGALPNNVYATDLVLTITNILRQHGVVGCFVEFFGSALKTLNTAQRATVANMAPEYGATCGFFPLDMACLNYLKLTGRSDHQVKLVEEYAKIQGLWHDGLASKHPHYHALLELNLADIKPSLAGPKRPQDRVDFSEMIEKMENMLGCKSEQLVKRKTAEVQDGDVVIAAITSCTNTSNPNVMIAAALCAKNAYEKGLKIQPWVKASLAPGSKVVHRYFEELDL